MPVDYSHVDRLQQGDKELLVKKNTAYGNDVLNATGLEGIGTRLYDKVNRLINLVNNPDIDTGDESVRDTLADISNYGILGRMLMDGVLTERPQTVYLAGPIDMANPQVRREWREMASTTLYKFGITCFDPNSAWSTPGRLAAEQKQAIDRFTIMVCDVVLAFLPRNIQTLGTIREIEFARIHGKRVLAVSDWAGDSAFASDLEMHASFESALSAIIGEKILLFPDGDTNQQSPEPSYDEEMLNYDQIVTQDEGDGYGVRDFDRKPYSPRTFRRRVSKY